jgi:hypothetical protein
MIDKLIDLIPLNPPFSKGDTIASPFNKGRQRGISKKNMEGFREAQPPFHIISPSPLRS